MSIRLNQSTINPGAEVILEIDLTNTSGKDIRIVRLRYGPPLYGFKVFDRDGRAAPLTPRGEAVVNGKSCWKGKNGETRCVMGGSASDQLVAPGGTAHDAFCLSDYVDLSQPNEYSVQLQRRDPYTKLLVDSNTISLTVGRRE